MTKVISNKKQLTRLVEIMGENIDIARGITGKAAAQKRWEEFTLELNSMGPPERDWEKWQRVWSDFKVKIKKKIKNRKEKIKETGGEPYNHHSFSNTEEAVIKMLQLDVWMNPPGKYFGLRIENNAEKINVPDQRSTEIRRENFHESADQKINYNIGSNVAFEDVPPERRPTKRTKEQSKWEKFFAQQSQSQKFYQKMLELIGGVQKSLNEIKNLRREQYYENREYKRKKLELKKRKIELIEEKMKNKDKKINGKLKLKQLAK